MVALRCKQACPAPLHAGTGDPVSGFDSSVGTSRHRVHRVVFEPGFRDPVAGDARAGAREKITSGARSLESVLGGDDGKGRSEKR